MGADSDNQVLVTSLSSSTDDARDDTSSTKDKQTLPVVLDKPKPSRWRIPLRRIRRPSGATTDDTATATNNAISSKNNQSRHCSNVYNFPNRFRLLFRNHQQVIKTAYRMAVLASLSYYPFHRISTKYLGGNTLRRFRLVVKQRFVWRFLQCHLHRTISRLLQWIRRLCRPKHANNDNNDASSCSDWMNQRVREAAKNHEYTLRYAFYDWFEPTAVPGVNYHDTDLLVSTSNHGNVLALTFAGTASAADHATNIQTFEKANHSGLFHGGGGGGVVVIDQQVGSNNNTTTSIIEGSLHRGFLNAYSRVDRGHVVSLLDSVLANSTRSRDLTSSLDRRFGHCVLRLKRKEQDEVPHNGTALSAGPEGSFQGSTEPSDNTTIHVKRNGVCRVRGESLMTILRDLVTEALSNGKTVHLSGHSLALDIIINFPDVPVSKLHLWTFGAPQVADDIFLQSAVHVVPRLRSFVEGNGRFHRFVTLSDSCQVDFVSTVTEKALPSHISNLRGRAARRLGGMKGTAVHFADPHYLLTTEQHDKDMSSSTNKERTIYRTKTISAIDAHAMPNYLEGISRESREHPLSTDLPVGVREWMGEDTKVRVAK